MLVIVIFGIAVLVGWVILHRSAQKSERVYWAEREATPPDQRDQHGMVDNSSSLGAIVAVIIIAFVVGFILIKMGMFPLAGGAR